MKILLKLLLIILAISFQLSAISYAEIPHLINYQGRLSDANDTPITGTRQITFRFYNVASGGTPLWEETQSVTINRGIFNVLLGSSTNLDLPFDEQYYLGIKMESDIEMSPRQRIASGAYAFRAKEVDNAVPPGAIIMWTGSSCPPGWRRMAELDGKFLAGGTTYNTAAGGSSATALTNHAHSLEDPGIDRWYGLGQPVVSHGGKLYVEGAGGSYHPFRHVNSATKPSGIDLRPEFATVILCEKE